MKSTKLVTRQLGNSTDESKSVAAIRLRGPSETPLGVPSPGRLVVVQAWGNGLEVQGSDGRTVSAWRGITTWLLEDVVVSVPNTTTVDLLFIPC